MILFIITNVSGACVVCSAYVFSACVFSACVHARVRVCVWGGGRGGPTSEFEPYT